MSYTWPATIPLPDSAYNGTATANTVLDTSLDGPIAARRKNNVITRKYFLKWRLDDAERTAWVDAYAAAQRGNEWVSMLLPLRDSNELQRVRFSGGSYQETYTAYFSWEITAEVEIHDLQMLTSTEIDGLVTWADYVYPPELSLPDNVVPASVVAAQTRTPFDNTINRQRQRYSTTLKQWELTFKLDTDQRYLWESIYQNKLDSGTKAITIKMPNAGLLEDTVMRFGQSYEVSYVSLGFWSVVVIGEQDFSRIISPVTVER